MHLPINSHAGARTPLTSMSAVAVPTILKT
jgi:hypothetical protein